MVLLDAPSGFLVLMCLGRLVPHGEAERLEAGAVAGSRVAGGLETHTQTVAEIQDSATTKNRKTLVLIRHVK